MVVTATTTGLGAAQAAPVIRSTAIGFVVGALIFAVLGMWMNTQIGSPLLSNPGPVGILAIIGGTTSGLVSPMLSRRRRSRRPGGESDS